MYAKNVHKYYHHIYVAVSSPSRCFVALPLSPLQAMSLLDGECPTAGLGKQNEEEKNKLRKRIQTTIDELEGISTACVLMCVRIFCLLLCFDVPAI